MVITLSRLKDPDMEPANMILLNIGLDPELSSNGSVSSSDQTMIWNSQITTFRNDILKIDMDRRTK